MKAYIEDHVRNRHEGVKKITFDLKQKGIEDSVIASGLAKISKNDDLANMNLLFDRKLPSLKTKPVKKALGLMVQHLMQKGFEYEKAQAFVEAREGLFGGNSADEKLIQKAVETLLKKRQKSTQSDHEFHEKAIRSLLNQGFSYPVVKKALERGNSDEN
jgi:SOS response regulatory protein OraA/RecX